MRKIKFMIEKPLILVDGNDLVIYETIEDAENDIEVLDIDEKLKLFDSTGKKLLMKIVIETISRRFLCISYKKQIQSVSISEISYPDNNYEELRSILINFLGKQNLVIDPKKISTQELVEKVGEFIPYRNWKTNSF